VDLKILYRGPLSSCNYGCQYCPFAKRKEGRAELARDREALHRFVGWVESRTQDKLGLFFTPWGEALVRPAYQEALSRLSWMRQVEKVAAQTNLSYPLRWTERANPARLAFWATYHPEWAKRASFVAKCKALDEGGFSMSVGVVGFARFREQIARLRDELPPHVYLWINAVKDELQGLSPQDRAFFSEIDPLYERNTRHYPSLGRACRAGAQVVSVDGQGDIRRCHFIPQVIGNLYRDPGIEGALAERPCSAPTCHCHIGYVHLDYLELGKVFGAGLLERVPRGRWEDWRGQET
jgi:hypothetical protein